MATLDHLSYSSISSYLLCARAWRFHYIDKLPVPASAPLVFGSAFHDALETILLDHAAEPVRVWAGAWEKQLEANKEIAWGDETPAELCNTGVRMLTAPDILSVIGAIRPSQIETCVELHVPGVPIPVVGYIDIIEQDGIPGDFKTSARSWGSDRAQDELQPLFYLAALNQAGMSVPENRFRHYVFIKTKTPKVEIWETTRTVSEMFWLFGLIRETWNAIQAGAFPPSGVGSFKCSPKYCEYWGMCRGR